MAAPEPAKMDYEATLVSNIIFVFCLWNKDINISLENIVRIQNTKSGKYTILQNTI
jgi:hypothetical protein